MTTWFEGNRSFFLGAQAELIKDDREIASTWASKHVVHNPAYKFVLGRFVEADRPNNNRQLFSLEGLQLARPSIQHAPMNMNHSSRRVVGAFIATELIYPTDAVPKKQIAQSGIDELCSKCGEAIPGDYEVCPKCAEAAMEAAGIKLNPYIESLGVMWRHYFPEEYDLIEDAESEGRLFYSMECIPREIQCAGDLGCGAKFAYAGRQSDDYCEHLNASSSDKYLINPHFTAGALIVPPVRPGWSHADVQQLVSAHSELAEQIYMGVSADMGHLAVPEWEHIMAQLLVFASR